MSWVLLLAVFAAEPGYVDSKACQPCHAGIYALYAKSGMGRSFARFQSLPATANYTHQGRRYLAAGNTMSRGAISLGIDFVIGSGNHSQTLIHQRSAGKWVELPLSWYAEGGGKWRMSPGYDRLDHSEFTREVSESCLFCHKGYTPELAIDCQRCHGPGEAHAKRQGPIVNPAKLTPERSLEVCLQCHLESASRTLPDSILRLGRRVNSFRPGEALGDYRVFFEFARPAESDRMTVNGAGYGLLQSACYLKSAGKLQCTTCHDPHSEFTLQEDRFDAACRSCHGQKHEAARTDCSGCHMPKRRTEDAVHVVMTDHRIRRDARPSLARIAETHGRMTGAVRPLYPRLLADSAEIRLYRAMAEGDAASMERALGELHSTDARAYFELGEAWKKQGRLVEALAAYRKSADARAVVAAVEILLRQSRLEEASGLLEPAVRQWPKDAKLWSSLAVIAVGRGQFAVGLQHARQALALDEEDHLAWWNFGVCLEATGDKAQAQEAYRRSTELRPPGPR
ncbi:tetratricopeptide repeat protein [Bryobacter aggregatus]|uniref:tetratricopeptide repeat protein n=1 Tax=Bryobacter aggregatus TaxID=360054 RepID=UPI0004E17508|nr:tetratricopeptide repeat protein [Bryobacter aggregatus]